MSPPTLPPPPFDPAHHAQYEHREHNSGVSVSTPPTSTHHVDGDSVHLTFTGHAPYEDDRSDGYDGDDEEPEVEFGGVPLPTMTSAAAYYQNMEMDDLDRELMGEDAWMAMVAEGTSAYHQEIYGPPSDEEPAMGTAYIDVDPFIVEDDPFVDDEQSNDPFVDQNVSNDPENEGSDVNEDHHQELGHMSAMEFLLTGATMPGPFIDEVVDQLGQLQHVQDGHDAGDLEGPGQLGPHDHQNVWDHQNMSLREFLVHWSRNGPEFRRHLGQFRAPDYDAVREQSQTVVSRVDYDDLDMAGDSCDVQGLNWGAMGTTHSEARRARKATYVNYTTMAGSDIHNRVPLREMTRHEHFFQFRRTDMQQEIKLSHFQLRNVIASTTFNHVFYAGKHKVIQYNPFYAEKNVVMDLTEPTVHSSFSNSESVQISTIAAAHNVLIAGGFYGEYGMTALDRPSHLKHTEGLVTEDQNSITNHIEINLSRHSGLPIAAFASNDNGLRILDCTTNQFISQQRGFGFPINCTAISPDRRLRVIVGDSENVTITNAETGDVLEELEGHRDHGFACAWADDGWHVATGNQDKQIKIWDARKWRKNGRSNPIATLPTELAGARSLKFSPIGSGPRVLVAAEPADIVSVIDASLYKEKQTLDFFGEIGGIAFEPEGQTLFVGNCDSFRGGVLAYERTWNKELPRMPAPVRDLSDEYESEIEWDDWAPTDSDVAEDSRVDRSLRHIRSRNSGLGRRDDIE